MAHSSYLSTYRLDNYNPRYFLSVFNPPVACSGTITATPANPTTTLAVTFTVGTYADLNPGWLIRIKTAGGLTKGYVRIRYTGSASPTSIPVRELSASHVAVVSGDLFQVLKFVPLDTKLIEANERFSPDGIPYGAQGSNPPPIPSSGGNSVGWVDVGQTYRTINTDGSNTSLVDPDSATPPTHFWVLPSGVAFAGGSVNTNASPVLQANVGSYLVQHNVHDPDNVQGANPQWTHHITHDANNLPYECILQDYSGDAENGVTWTVEVLDSGITPDTIFEQALCFLWVDDVFSPSGRTDLGRSVVTGRSHILGMGYARRVTLSGSGEDGVTHLTFDIQSPLARLQEIASYSKVMLESASPDSWNKLKTLGFRRGITQLVQYYTTLSEAGYDFVYNSNFSDARYPAHYINRSDPIGQIRELADARQGRLVAREWGARLEVQYHPALLPLASRSAIDLILTPQDVYDFEWSTELADSTELFELQGVTAGASGNAAVFSRVGIGGGKNADTISRKAPDSQTQANQWAGMVYAQRENIFQNGTGAKYRVGELTLRCPGQYAVLDFTTEYVQFDHTTDWLGFSAFRFWLKRFTLEVDADTGASMTTFTFQCETAAQPGVTFVPATEATPPYTPPTDIPLPYTPPGSRLPAASGRQPVKLVAADFGSGKFARAESWDSATGAVTWENISTGLPSGANVYGVHFSADPFDYRRYYYYVGVVGAANPAVGGLYKCDNVWASSPSWSLVKSATGIFGANNCWIRRMVMSINRKNYIALTTGTGTIARSFDAGATWALSDINGNPPAASTDGSAISAPDFALSPYGGGRGYAIGGSFGAFPIAVTNDWGATWSAAGGAPDLANGGSLNVPYIRADGSTPNKSSDGLQELVACGGAGHGANVGRIWYSKNGGASVFQIYAVSLPGTDLPSGVSIGSSLNTWTYDGGAIIAATLLSGAGGNLSGVATYDYDNITSAPRTMVQRLLGANQSGHVNGFPTAKEFFLQWSHSNPAIYYTLNGVTMTAMTYPSFFAGGSTGACEVQWDLSDFVSPA